MALKHLALIFLCSLVLSSPHEIEARTNQMFNKIPSNTNDVEVEVKHSQQNLPKKEATDLPFNNPDQQQEEEQPNFIPQNTENNFGLYGHETQNNNNKDFPYNAKYLPKNYNTEAYVTQPEDFNENSFTDNSYTNTPTNNNNNYQTQDINNKYYNAQKKDTINEFESMDTEDNTFANDNINNYDNTDSTNNGYYNNDVVSNNNNNFNTRFMDASETTNNNNNNNYYSSGKSRVNNRVEPQGMSDTRLMENGRYHYDIKSGTYNLDHPYVNTMAMRKQYNPTEYNNIDNSDQYNNYNEEEVQYQTQDNMP